MDRKTARRFNRLIWQARLKKAAPVILAVLLILSLYGAKIWDELDPKTEEATGRVVSWSRAQDDSSPGNIVVSVALENGAEVTAIGRSTGPSPRIGATITVVRVETRIGRVFYRWAPNSPPSRTDR